LAEEEAVAAVAAETEELVEEVFLLIVLIPVEVFEAFKRSNWLYQ
jgi:hypothetical protein